MENEGLYDVTVIGGGPIGLFTTFYSGMRELKTKLIESSPDLGGKITMFYPEKMLRDIGGVLGITGADLVKQLEQQAKTFEPTIICGQLISDLQRNEDGTFLLTTSTGEIHHTKTIILTVGAGIFKPIKLDLSGAEFYENSNLHYSVDELETFRDKNVLISGGGNSAVDWANELISIAESITVIHRREEFGGHERHVANMKKMANILTPYELKELLGEENLIKQVIIKNLETGDRHTIEVDALVVNHGIQGDFGGINDWGLNLREERFVVNGAMETNIPGIFAAGDAVTYPNKLKLIAGGFREGPIAVNSAKKYLKPDSEPMSMYSTHHEKLLVVLGQEKTT
ncbi:NAD(P)/FAD-dependent oxidoreductase [Peribacillus cavernae]|uniref:Ferredoxin--NADP reductase n=1 Tax=Peribacillus cavernae TaxID=1674310 RepID=A0A433H975_9BACI|nr:NAD(P)/FAD-dependent oxidoreductase [Peribacillus cavernae]MDQ0220824.1 thioredoxin reductase (NADPH) [Peribacillus cavernae]RUQ24833.1 NAD(P)/FAD-dependent oxidoreductase [Peribacillus cavernae]